MAKTRDTIPHNKFLVNENRFCQMSPPNNPGAIKTTTSHAAARLTSGSESTLNRGLVSNFFKLIFIDFSLTGQNLPHRFFNRPRPHPIFLQQFFRLSRFSKLIRHSYCLNRRGKILPQTLRNCPKESSSNLMLLHRHHRPRPSRRQHHRRHIKRVKSADINHFTTYGTHSVIPHYSFLLPPANIYKAVVPSQKLCHPHLPAKPALSQFQTASRPL